MEIQQVKKAIQGKAKLCPFYVFTGAEIEAQRIYINKIAEVTGKQIKRIESASGAFNKRAGIIKTSNLFVCRDDMDFWKQAMQYEDVAKLLGDNMLILQMTEIDKRSKASKLYAEQTVTFNYMDSEVLYKYLEMTCSLSDDRAYELIDICECDYSRILLECDKINRYADACACTPDEAYDKLIQDKAITRPPKDAIFDFTDAMLRGQIPQAFRLLEDCKAIGEPSLRIISVLYSNFKRVLQYQVAESKDICKETGLTPFDVKLAKQSAGTWDSRDLVFFLRTLQSIEQGIKQGEIEDSIALDYLMVSIL